MLSSLCRSQQWRSPFTALLPVADAETLLSAIPLIFTIRLLHAVPCGSISPLPSRAHSPSLRNCTSVFCLGAPVGQRYIHQAAWGVDPGVKGYLQAGHTCSFRVHCNVCHAENALRCLQRFNMFPKHSITSSACLDCGSRGEPFLFLILVTRTLTFRIHGTSSSHRCASDTRILYFRFLKVSIKTFVHFPSSECCLTAPQDKVLTVEKSLNCIVATNAIWLENVQNRKTTVKKSLSTAKMDPPKPQSKPPKQLKNPENP